MSVEFLLERDVFVDVLGQRQAPFVDEAEGRRGELLYGIGLGCVPSG